ncbi:MAG: Flp family type IVb pilin [Gemmataceae bacterium]|nr:Flp family type IVb pilin [Gemmataceae bacterium]
MGEIQKKIQRFLRSEEGPTAVEYAIMVALILVVAIGAITFLGTSVSSSLSKTADVVSQVPKTGK